MIGFVAGSLFSTNKTHSLAQCISGDVRHGLFQGISVEFMKIYPELEKLREHNVLELGEVVPVMVDGKYIYNLVTKPHHWQKPVPNDIHAALKTMKEHALKHSVKAIAMPFLGSGRDKLDFLVDVLPLIYDVFENSHIDIHIYSRRPVSVSDQRSVMYIVIDSFIMLRWTHVKVSVV